MRKSILLFALSLFLLTGLIHCGGSVTTGVNTDIDNYADVDAGSWNSNDLKRVVNKMVQSIDQHRMLRRISESNPAPRWILASEMQNDTDEHLSTRLIMEKVRTQLVKRGMAIFVDDQALNDILKEMSLQQSALFDPNKAVKVGKLAGARLILRGRISNIRKSTTDTTIVFYNVTLQVVDIQTREIIWTDEAEISRRWDKPTFR